MAEGRYKLIILAPQLVYLGHEVNLQLVLFTLTIFSAWCFIWATNKRAAHYTARVSKELSKIIRLIVFYFVQLSFYYMIRKNFLSEKKSLLSEIIGIETFCMASDLLFEFPKFLINIYEHYSFYRFKNKQQYFLIWELMISIMKLAVQGYFLYRITVDYNFPFLFIRDALFSLIQTVTLIAEYIKGFKLASKVSRYLDFLIK